MAIAGAVTAINIEVEALERWLDELDVLRDGVMQALYHRREARDMAKFPVVRVTVTSEVTAAGVKRVRRKVSVLRRPPVPTSGAVSWWLTQPAKGFTETALRDHRDRWSRDPVAAFVDGAASS